MTAPFTPPQWKTGTHVSEGTNLSGAAYMDPCDRTCISTNKKCSSNLTDYFKGNEHDAVRSVVDCSCNVDGQIGVTNSDDLTFNGEKCDNCGDRDLSTPQALGNIINLVTNRDANSLETDKCNSAEFEADNADIRHRESVVSVERRTCGISSVETGSCDFSKKEKSIIENFTTNDEPLSNEFNKEPASSGDIEATRRAWDSADPSSITNTSSEDKMISGDSDTIADSETVCRRKPRKKKPSEMASAGKPQFHHPPKSIFKPTVQVRQYN